MAGFLPPYIGLYNENVIWPTAWSRVQVSTGRWGFNKPKGVLCRPVISAWGLFFKTKFKRAEREILTDHITLLMVSFLLPFKPAVLEYVCVKQCAVHGTVVLGLRSPSQAKYKLWHVYRHSPLIRLRSLIQAFLSPLMNRNKRWFRLRPFGILPAVTRKVRKGLKRYAKPYQAY